MPQIRPFTIDIPQSDLDDLHRRIEATRWPGGPSDDTWARGVPPRYLRRLARYWRESYDWRATERRLNSLPQFRTKIDGQNLHFLHVRSPHEDALPLLLFHGWPSSFVEFERVIPQLTDPDDPADAFHVVVPSLPGFGFSTPLHAHGWGDLKRIAEACAALMHLLGYQRYVAQGGDIGAGVMGILGMLDAQRLAGVHMNGPMPYPFGPPLDVESFTGRDRDRAERFNAFRADGLGYLHQQATRPQTAGYGLNDSPVTQLAWIAEKFQEWSDPAAERPERAVDKRQLLDNASIYWFTGSGNSSAHTLYEGMRVYGEAVRQAGGAALPVAGKNGPPTAVAVFAADHSIRPLMDPEDAVQRWTEYDVGGHFPAMEVPDVYVTDVREFFGTLRCS
jgi:pimeloyl-ACP methyl ester carboxylesterase